MYGVGVGVAADEILSKLVCPDSWTTSGRKIVFVISSE